MFQFFSVLPLLLILHHLFVNGAKWLLGGGGGKSTWRKQRHEDLPFKWGRKNENKEIQKIEEGNEAMKEIDKQAGEKKKDKRKMKRSKEMAIAAINSSAQEKRNNIEYDSPLSFSGANERAMAKRWNSREILEIQRSEQEVRKKRQTERRQEASEGWNDMSQETAEKKEMHQKWFKKSQTKRWNINCSKEKYDFWLNQNRENKWGELCHQHEELKEMENYW